MISSFLKTYMNESIIGLRLINIIKRNNMSEETIHVIHLIYLHYIMYIQYYNTG